MIPKLLYSCELQLIMPCFCSGANQKEAELRVSAMRGELRWWFRALGGTREQENRVFGSVAGSGCASAVRLILESPDGAASYIPRYDKPAAPDSPVNSGYITIYLMQQERRALPAGLRFNLRVIQLRPIVGADSDLLEKAWKCFCNLGTIGARHTRGLGAFAPIDPAERCADRLLTEIPFLRRSHCLLGSKLRTDFSPETSKRILQTYAGWLADKRKEHRAKTPSPLGGANPRHASAIRFRPILTADNLIQLCIYQAPDSTLAPHFRSPVIKL